MRCGPPSTPIESPRKPRTVTTERGGGLRTGEEGQSKVMLTILLIVLLVLLLVGGLGWRGRSRL
jgi:hypothetical protein